MKNIESIIKNATASLAMEGLKPSKEAVNINRQFLEGNISSEEAVKKIKESHLGSDKK